MKFMAAMVACVMLAGILQADEKDRDAQLEAQLTGTVFAGVFTIDGRPGQPAEEEYTILKVKKAGEGDLWVFTARIKYGNKDVTLPVPVPIKWAGKTPVIEAACQEVCDIPALFRSTFFKITGYLLTNSS